MMTVEEVEEYLRIRPSTVLSQVRENKIPYTRLGKKILFPRSSIRIWIISLTKGPNSVVKEWKSVQLAQSRMLPWSALSSKEKKQIAESWKAIDKNDLVTLDL